MKINRTAHFTRLSQDEKRLYNVGGTISAWEIDGEKPIEKYKIKALKNPSFLTLSSNNQLLAYSNTSGHMAVAETETGQIIAKSKGTKLEGNNILFIHENSKVLASDWKGNLFTWDIESGKINIVKKLPIILTDIFSCNYGTKVIITGRHSKSKKKYLRLWEMKLQGKLEPKEILLDKKYYGMSCSLLHIVGKECFFFDEAKKNGAKVYSLDLESKEIREVINIPLNGKRNLYNIEGYYTSLCVSTDKRFLILGFSDTVIAFDLLEKECLGILRYKNAQVVSDLNFFANNTKILISTWNNIKAMDFPDCFLNKI